MSLPAPPAVVGPYAATAGTHRPVVLIIDDHGPSRLVAASAIAPLGALVTECASATEAWATLDALLPDVILLDLMMPDIDGVTFARMVRADARLCEIPILMITAATGREERLSALEAGVDDFLTKPVDRIELRARVATVCRLGRFRKLVEERQRTASLVTLAPIGVVVIDVQTAEVRFANQRARDFLPTIREGESLLSQLEASAVAQLTRMMVGHAEHATEHDEPGSMRWSLAGGARQCDVAAGHVMWDDARALQLVFTDVTGMRQVEEQLHRKDRLDAVGRLAASVAHDFATIVQVCQMHLFRVRGEPASETMQSALTEMQEALRRGGLMTQDLLRFCRRPDAKASRGTCDAAEVLRGIERLLSRLASVSIAVHIEVPDGEVPVGLAAHELEQAVVNLVSNARDAIHAEGRIDVTLRVAAGGVAQLSVRDTGTGMPPEIAARIGEPFFTTKAEGQGTGLGLWMVRRVLEEAHGTLDVQTQQGEGTVVTLAMPLLSGAAG
ncbi:MAG: hybrid sensor histidine kinase/response regulator [Gemmatimonadetes bacterium]|nr:hybrid sensor histidine kinase/response regulator [Gemmatimonadota bacterium]